MRLPKPLPNVSAPRRLLSDYETVDISAHNIQPPPFNPLTVDSGPPTLYPYSTTTIMNSSMLSPATTTTSIPRGPPAVVTYRFQQETGSEMAYVPLAGSHEEAQEQAARAFPSLATVDPRWLFFTITIRYKSTNERQEIGIAPAAWVYVTSKLVPYRLIDVHVVPPSPASHYHGGTSTRSNAPSYYHQSSPVKNDTASLPPHYPESPPTKSHEPPLYPDSPPPEYPGSPKKQLHPHLGHGYGYGFGWHDQTGGTDYDVDPHEMADRRSAGWSASSARREPSGAGVGVHRWFSRVRQNGFGIFPITWDDAREERRRARARRRREREQRMHDHDHDPELESGSGSGRSYVPSLI